MGLHDGHRQRMRQQFLSHGPQSMADHELLELALFYAIPRRDTNETAHRLLEQFGSLDRVLTAPEQELEQVEGVGQNAAVLLRLIGAMGDRARQPGREEKIVASVDQAGAYFLRLLDGQRTEQLYQLCVDGKGKVLSCRVLSQGQADMTVLSLRQAVENVRGQRRVPGPQPPQRRGPAFPGGCSGHRPGPGRPEAAGYPAHRPHYCGRWRLCFHGLQRTAAVDSCHFGQIHEEN